MDVALAPTQIGQYRIRRELGRGANGVVYLASVEGLDRRCALKVLPGASRQSEEAIKRFRLEANIASKLESPGIARVWDLGWHGNHLYYVMDYCEGPTLRERLAQDGRLEAEEARGIILGLARAMQTAHAQGVLHRDLKPSNVILAARGPVITDFGLAQDRDLSTSLTRTGQMVGTPVYMSPEQLRGLKDVDPRADVYGLGVVFYECLTGRLPYHGASAHETGTAILRGRAQAPSTFVASIPADLEAVCLKAMAKDRDERYANGGELAAALEGCAPDPLRAPTERQSAASPAPAPPRKGLKVPLAVGAGALILLTVLGAWLGLRAVRLKSAETSLAYAERLLGEGSPAAEVGAALDDGLQLADGDADLVLQGTRTRSLLDAREALAGWRSLLAQSAPPEAYARLLEDTAVSVGEGGVPPWLEVARGAVESAYLASRVRRDVRDGDVLELTALLETLPADADTELRVEANTLRRLLDARDGLEEALRRSRRVAPFEEVLGLLQEASLDASSDAALSDRISLELAGYYLRRGRFQKATELSRRLADRPGAIGLKARYLEAYARIRSDDRAAIGMLKSIWEDDPEGALGLNAGAAFHVFNARGAESEPLARRALALDPNSADAHMTLAFALVDQRRNEEAMQSLARAAELAPDHPRLHLARAFALGGLNRIEPALESYERIVELTKPTPIRMAIRNRMQIFVQLRRHGELKRDADLLLDQDAKDIAALFWRGYAAEQEGDEASARRDWMRAREIDRPRFVALVRSSGEYANVVRYLLFGRRPR